MTPEELDRLKDLCAKATPGPWTKMGGNYPDKDDIVGSLEESPPQRHHIFGEWQHMMRDADVSFISASRTAVPAMIAEIERLRSALKDIQMCMGGAEGQNGFDAPEDVWRIAQKALGQN